MKSMRTNRGRLLSVVGIVLLFSIAPVFSDEQLDKAVQEVEQSTQKHVQVLTDLLAKVPPSAKPSIEHAIAVSQRGRNIAVEAVELSQTDDPLQRAALHRKHAEKRVAEIQAMEHKGKPEFVETLAADYEDSVGEAHKEIDKAKSQGKNADAETAALEQSTSRHTQVLSALLNKAPEQARKGLARALEASQRGKSRELGAVKRTQTDKPAAGKPGNSSKPADSSKQEKQRDKQKQNNESRQSQKGARNAKSPRAKGRGL